MVRETKVVIINKINQFLIRSIFTILEMKKETKTSNMIE